MNKLAIAAALTAVAVAQYDPAAPAETTTAAPPAEYYYADYDNVVVAAKDAVYYSSALTQEAVDRTKQGSAASWSQPKQLVNNLYNAKGAVFCGNQYAKDAPEGGKYGQLFVADEGDDANEGKVVGWDVVADPANPAAIKLQNKWDVYANGDKAKPSDVECGPNNGLFIADKGNDAIYWVNGADLKAKKPDAWAPVVPKDCGAAVAEVRSVTYDAAAGKLLWTNNDEAVAENSGVFSYNQAADAMVAPVSCEAAKCDAWSQDCSSKIKKAVPAAEGEKAWAVADAWGNQQVSKGGKEVYNQAGKEVAAVPQEATYAEAANDEKRDVLFVADQKAGEVYAAPQNQPAKKIAEVPDAYGVAYNNAWGWNEALGEGSASSVSLAVGAVLATLALFL